MDVNTAYTVHTIHIVYTVYTVHTMHTVLTVHTMNTIHTIHAVHTVHTIQTLYSRIPGIQDFKTSELGTSRGWTGTCGFSGLTALLKVNPALIRGLKINFRIKN